jgi:hypothetical protein
MHKTNKNKRNNKYFKKYMKRTKTLKNNICKKGMTDETYKFLKLIKGMKKNKSYSHK